MELTPIEVMAHRYARMQMLFSEMLRLLQPTEDEVKAFQSALDATVPQKVEPQVDPDAEGHPI